MNINQNKLCINSIDKHIIIYIGRNLIPLFDLLKVLGVFDKISGFICF